jgi:hypothetical protein
MGGSLPFDCWIGGAEMNARHNEAIERFRKLETNPPAFTLEEISWEMAEEKFLTAERIGSWIESCNCERESSVYWGPISSEELILIIFGDKANSEQRNQAVITIRRRFFAEHPAEIAELASGF